MTFDNIHRLLLWYFNRKWLRPPKQPGNHSPFYVDNRNYFENPAEVWRTVVSIEAVLKRISPRRVELMRQLFTSLKPSELAKRIGVSERRVRQIRRETVDSIRIKCQEDGLLGGQVVYIPVMLRKNGV